MAFEKTVLSVVYYGLDFPFVTPIAFTINMRYTRGLFEKKFITRYSDMNMMNI